MEESIKEAKEILMLTFPAQGHVNSFINLAHRLTAEGIRVTMACTEPYESRFADSSTELLRFVALPHPAVDPNGRMFFTFILTPQSQLRDASRLILSNMIQSNSKPCCILSDRFFHWAPDLALSFGIPCACVYTPSLAAALVDSQIPRIFAESREFGESGLYHVDGLPPLHFWDLPIVVESKMAGFDPVNYRVPHMLAKVKWILVNTVEELEGDLLKYLPKAIPIGPFVSNKLLGLPEQDQGVLPSLHKPDQSCIEWLNQRAPSSVLYVSFGSVAPVSAQQTQEIALGLEDSKQPFLWVIRSGMVVNDGFMQEFERRNEENGLVISWAPQIEVLKHPSIAGFMTHCGWNSIVESLCSGGIPLLGLPLMAEQPLNSKMIEDVWKIGVRFSRNENGIVSRKEVGDAIRKLMNESHTLKQKAVELGDVTRKAILPNGSSFLNFKAFLSSL